MGHSQLKTVALGGLVSEIFGYLLKRCIVMKA
jgi:hypothetical protein